MNVYPLFHILDSNLKVNYSICKFWPIGRRNCGGHTSHGRLCIDPWTWVSPTRGLSSVMGPKKCDHLVLNPSYSTLIRISIHIVYMSLGEDDSYKDAKMGHVTEILIILWSIWLILLFLPRISQVPKQVQIDRN